MTMKNEEEKNNDMFVMANYQAMEEICKVCGIRAWGIYVWLLRHRNVNNMQSYPSLKTLAEECNVSLSTIQRELNRLEEKGYIKRNSGGIEDNHNVSNRYYMTKFDLPKDEKKYDAYKKQIELARKKKGHKPKRKCAEIIQFPEDKSSGQVKES